MLVNKKEYIFNMHTNEKNKSQKVIIYLEAVLHFFFIENYIPHMNIPIFIDL